MSLVWGAAPVRDALVWGEAVAKGAGVVDLARRQEPQTAAALRRAWAAHQASVSAAGLAHALAHGGAAAARALDPAGLGRRQSEALVPRLRDAFLRGADYANVRLGLAHKAPRRPLRVDLQRLNPAAAAWARAHAGELVQGDDDLREIVGVFIETAQAEGVTVEETARALRTVVGLDNRRATAVSRFWDKLTADPNVSDATRDRRVERYATAQLRDRAETIARTEIIGSTNGGQTALWREAVRSGVLQAREFVKVWIVTDDDQLCDECEEMDGETTDLDDEFSSGDEAPPLHTNCRCAVGLQAREEEE